jgi:hypothetical protein
LPSKKLKVEKSPISIESHYLSDRRGSKTPVLSRKISRKSSKFMNFDGSKQEAFMSSTMRLASPTNDKIMMPTKELIKTTTLSGKSRNGKIKYSTYSEQASIAKSNRDYINAQKIEFLQRNGDQVHKHHYSHAKMMKNSSVIASTIEDNSSFAGSFVTRIPGNRYEMHQINKSDKN